MLKGRIKSGVRGGNELANQKLSRHSRICKELADYIAEVQFKCKSSGKKCPSSEEITRALYRKARKELVLEDEFIRM